jgi:hypothetical protein
MLESINWPRLGVADDARPRGMEARRTTRFRGPWRTALERPIPSRVDASTDDNPSSEAANATAQLSMRPYAPCVPRNVTTMIRMHEMHREVLDGARFEACTIWTQFRSHFLPPIAKRPTRAPSRPGRLPHRPMGQPVTGPRCVADHGSPALRDLGPGQRWLERRRAGLDPPQSELRHGSASPHGCTTRVMTTLSVGGPAGGMETPAGRGVYPGSPSSPLVMSVTPMRGGSVPGIRTVTSMPSGGGS